MDGEDQAQSSRERAEHRQRRLREAQYKAQDLLVSMVLDADGSVAPVNPWIIEAAVAIYTGSQLEDLTITVHTE